MARRGDRAGREGKTRRREGHRTGNTPRARREVNSTIFALTSKLYSRSVTAEGKRDEHDR